MIAVSGGCQGESLLGRFEEVLDDGNYPFGFRKWGEVAGIRDHRKFSVGDEPKALDGMLHADKIVISNKNEKRHFDRRQLLI